MTAPPSPPRVGIALGGGSARGWAHIGVLRALTEHGIEPEIVCGTSIGAFVGGIYSAGKLAELESWVVSLGQRDVLALMDVAVGSGGMIRGRKLMELYRAQLGDVRIEELPKRFAAVATDLEEGSEVWLQDGPLLDAIRASISIPAVFTPVRRDGRWLVDGGLVNPVPVSLCRVMGAEVVIAVTLHGGRLVPAHRARSGATQAGETQAAVVRGGGLRERLVGRRKRVEEPAPPGLASIVVTSMDIMQDRLSRMRLAGDPPDLLLTPRVRHVWPLEFTAGQPTIEEGYRIVHEMLPALRYLLGRESAPRRGAAPADGA